MSRKIVVTAAILLAILLIAGYFLLPSAKKTIFKIFHAGSLSGAFEKIEAEFEIAHSEIDVQRESGGSAELIRWIMDTGRYADVLASSDYTLIDTMIEAKAADFSIRFAANELVIAYTERSEYHTELNATNWYKIFQRPDVRLGFSNPNYDPCGYRAVIMFQLAEIYYNNATIFDELIVSQTAITAFQNGTNYTIHVPANLNPGEKTMIRPKEVDLLAALETGALDYIIIYRSIAYQHRSSGVRAFTLPPELNLGESRLANFYSAVSLVQFYDLPGKMRNIAATPIAYGLTVPKSVQHYETALEFIKFVIGPRGQHIMMEFGLTPFFPARTANSSAVPEPLRGFVIEERW